MACGNGTESQALFEPMDTVTMACASSIDSFMQISSLPMVQTSRHDGAKTFKIHTNNWTIAWECGKMHRQKAD